MRRPLLTIARALTCALLLCGHAIGHAQDADSVYTAGRHSEFKRSAVGAAIGLGINASVTELLKASIHERRPDGSGNRSFPSRHTSYAVTIATIASHELYRHSPFWVTAFHTAANAVAMQRVLADRHYAGDVLAGAAIGLISAETGYALSDLIFGNAGHRRTAFAYDNMPVLSAETAALIPFHSHGSGRSISTGIEAALRLSLPIGDYLGFGASARLRSHPLYIDGGYVGALNSVGLTADVYAVRSVFDGSWAVDARVSAGLLRNFNRPYHLAASWSPLVDITAGLGRKLSRNFVIEGRVGLDIADRPGPWSALKLALVTKAEF